MWTIEIYNWKISKILSHCYYCCSLNFWNNLNVRFISGSVPLLYLCVLLLFFFRLLCVAVLRNCNWVHFAYVEVFMLDCYVLVYNTLQATKNQKCIKKYPVAVATAVSMAQSWFNKLIISVNGLHIVHHPNTSVVSSVTVVLTWYLKQVPQYLRLHRVHWDRAQDKHHYEAGPLQNVALITTHLEGSLFHASFHASCTWSSCVNLHDGLPLTSSAVIYEPLSHDQSTS